MDIGQLDLYKDDSLKAIKPVWASKGYKTERGFLEWAYNVLPTLEKMHELRIRHEQNNLLWYTGEYDTNLEYMLVAPGRAPVPVNRYTVPTVINHLYNVTEQKVSRTCRDRPDFLVAATNDEESDRINARTMQHILDSVMQQNNFDFLIQDLERWTAVFGQTMVSTEWNPLLGDKNEETQKPIGDVEIKIKEPYFVLYEPRRVWKEVRFFIEIYDILNIEEVRKKWKVSSLQPDSLQTLYSFQGENEREKMHDDCIIYRFVYKPDDYIPEGMEVLYTGNKVLEFNTQKYKYSHNQLPYDRHTDIDVPGKVFPISSYRYLIPVQHSYNVMTSMINRGITLCGHAKWVIEKGSCDVKSLGNMNTIVHKNPGAPDPKLLQFQPVSPDVYQHRNQMKQELLGLSGTAGVSVGSPPPGARAGSIVNFYKEQETERNSSGMLKHNELIRNVVRKAGSVVGDFYPEYSQRLIRIVGKSNQYNIYRLREVKFSSNYAILVQNSNGLPKSQEGKQQFIEFMQQHVPGLLTNQQIANIYGIDSPDKFFDVATASLQSAEIENEMLMEGTPIMPPEPYEDLITHWTQHTITMQSQAFKHLPKRLQQSAKLHVTQTEGLMEEASQRNPAFKQLLLSLPQYPIFWAPTPEADDAASAASQAGAPQGPSPQGPPLPPPGNQAPMPPPPPPAPVPEAAPPAEGPPAPQAQEEAATPQININVNSPVEKDVQFIRGPDGKILVAKISYTTPMPPENNSQSSSPVR